MMKMMNVGYAGICMVALVMFSLSGTASAAFYYDVGGSWVAGDVPDGAVFSEINNDSSRRRGQDRQMTNEPLENSGFFNSVTPSNSLNTSAIGYAASSSGTSDSGQWTADLNGIYLIDKITIHSAAFAWQGLHGSTVSYSLDGENWFEAGTVALIPGNSTPTAHSADVDFGGIGVRYLRLDYSHTSTNFHYRMDSMDVYVIPEPASIVLTGAGAMLLLTRRHRKIMK